jgi:hypothetical protein
MSLSPSSTVPVSRPSVKAVLRGVAATVCAGSAGVHAALVPEHLHESVPLGLSFGAAAVLLGVAAAVTGLRNDLRLVAPVAALLIGTAVAYLLSRTTGLPGLVDHPEPVDALGSATSFLEVAAACACVRLIALRSSK